MALIWVGRCVLSRVEVRVNGKLLAVEMTEGGVIERLLHWGQTRWPSITIEAGLLMPYVESLDAESANSLKPERAADLFLAYAAVAGDNQAIAIFVAEFGPLLRSMSKRLESVGISVDDAVAAMIHQFTVSDTKRRAKLEQYRGTGSLRSWVRAVAARAFIDMHRSAVRTVDVVVSVDEAILENVADDTDPEIAYLKRHYRGEFRSAFTAAIGELSSESRTFLRHLFVDRLSVRQLAAAYGFHHATAARRITNARTELLERTRDHLCARLEVTDGKLDSIMRLINSRFDVSVARLLDD